MKLIALLAILWLPLVSLQASTLLYSTSFEASEGYNIDLPLAGQNGWVVEGTGNAGLLEDFIPGYGQHAYIGFSPENPTSATTVWRPIGFSPVPESAYIVKFSVLMQIYPSTVGGNDEFRWSVYNTEGVRLFSLDFFTSNRGIYYELQNPDETETEGVLYDTGLSFEFTTEESSNIYQELVIWMDLAYNSWTAVMNDQVLVNAAPITQRGSALTLGDIDAVWALESAEFSGDNFMVFDDYTVTAESLSAIPPYLENLGVTPEGHYEFLVHAQPEVRYSVEVTGDFKTWDSLLTFVNDGGTFTFLDDTAQNFKYGFYRVVELP